jgi:patatin-like phospholipase/acyl hydrolase
MHELESVVPLTQTAVEVFAPRKNLDRRIFACHEVSKGLISCSMPDSLDSRKSYRVVWLDRLGAFIEVRNEKNIKVNRRIPEECRFPSY